MESNFLTAVFLPIGLFVVMRGMGVGLSAADPKRIVIASKAIIIGLLAQLVMIPVVGFLLASTFAPSSGAALSERTFLSKRRLAKRCFRSPWLRLFL